MKAENSILAKSFAKPLFETLRFQDIVQSLQSQLQTFTGQIML